MTNIFSELTKSQNQYDIRDQHNQFYLVKYISRETVKKNFPWCLGGTPGSKKWLIVKYKMEVYKMLRI